VASLPKDIKKPVDQKSNWLIHITLIVGRARFERAIIALKEPCDELYTAYIIELKRYLKFHKLIEAYSGPRNPDISLSYALS